MKPNRTKTTFAALLIGALATIATAAEVEHTFTLDVSKWEQKPTKVNLVGEFNKWSKDATPMTKADENTWSVKVKLAPGKHPYKFLVDGERWLPDPKADKAQEVDDTFGGKNSVVVIEEKK